MSRRYTDRRYTDRDIREWERKYALEETRKMMEERRITMEEMRKMEKEREQKLYLKMKSDGKLEKLALEHGRMTYQGKTDIIHRLRVIDMIDMVIPSYKEVNSSYMDNAKNYIREKYKHIASYVVGNKEINTEETNALLNEGVLPKALDVIYEIVYLCTKNGTVDLINIDLDKIKSIPKNVNDKIKNIKTLLTRIMNGRVNDVFDDERIWSRSTNYFILAESIISLLENIENFFTVGHMTEKAEKNLKDDILFSAVRARKLHVADIKEYKFKTRWEPRPPLSSQPLSSHPLSSYSYPYPVSTSLRSRKFSRR